MTNVNPQVVSLLTSLFQHGIETYNSSIKKSENVGGAKFWSVRGWKQPNNGHIRFNSEDSPQFYEALKHARATLYTVNRVQLDEDNNIVYVENTKQQNRINHSLMLYCQQDANRNSADRIIERLLNEMPELEGYVYNLIDIKDSLDEIGMVVKNEYGDDCLKEVTHYSLIDNTRQPLVKLQACVYIAVTSGGEGSSQLWSYARKTTTREQAVARFDMAKEALNKEDMPF